MDGVDPSIASSADELPEGAWTVARLNSEIERVLSDSRDRFPAHVVGELAEVDEYDFGTFFELRDLESEPVISCLAWSSAVEDFEYELESGTEAVVEVSVDFYPDRGDCQLLVSGYWPLGESDRRQELDTLRRQFAEEGLFDDERKQPIPPHPACIGLVTSPPGSAREDAWTAVGGRSPRTDVKLCGATVQGENAVPSMIDAIQHLDSDPEVETIILTRGGGSDVDLWCFNVEPLVRCVAACSTPVVVAIGHEDDDTLVEHVADARAMTPTEAGVVVTSPLDAVLGDLETVERRIDGAYRLFVDDRLEQLDRRIETGYESLEQRAARRESFRQRARDLEQRIETAYTTLIDAQLESFETRIDRELHDRELAAESEAATARAVRGRIHDIEARIDASYRGLVSRELDGIEHRIETAYRDRQAEARVEKRAQQVRRLRVVVAILVAIILLGTVAIVLVLL